MQEFKLPKDLSSDDVSFGFGGLTLFPAEEISQAQLGYSVGLDGESLVGKNEGDWFSNWVVIGMDQLVGDPISIDTDKKEYPVFSAPHGEGTWNPELIANSYSGFKEIVGELKKLAASRENPVALEKTPSKNLETDAFLEFARSRVKDTYYWELLVLEEDA